MDILLLPGDGVGPEVMIQAERVLAAVAPDIDYAHALVGGAAIAESGHPLPSDTLERASRADAILFGAVGDARYDHLDRALRPEQAILTLRSELGLFANLRPVRMFAGLESASSLRREVATGIDLLIVRELNGDVYFGDKGLRRTEAGDREGYDMMSYSESEVRRIAHVAFRAARQRERRLCSVDKANVLETSQLWRDVVCEVARDYPDVELSHLYVDNAAMQLVRDPSQFDVLVTGNLFGDILSDQASMCAGSIGLLASAALGDVSESPDSDSTRSSAPRKLPKGLYEPIHGSAPDISGQNIANPLAMILSLAMLLRHSKGDETAAMRIEKAVAQTISEGARTRDMGGDMTTTAMGDRVLSALV